MQILNLIQLSDISSSPGKVKPPPPPADHLAPLPLLPLTPQAAPAAVYCALQGRPSEAAQAGHSAVTQA